MPKKSELDKIIESDILLDRIQVSECGKTAWIHATDGSTIGRFSKTFGMDVHRSGTEQTAGKSECLHCTHEAGTQEDWKEFCRLMKVHHGVDVPESSMKFDVEKARRPGPR